MRALAIIASGAALLLAASPAFACRQLIPRAKFQHSDIVVDGEARCLQVADRCQLKVSAVLKGDENLAARTLDIVVTEAQLLPELGENEIRVGVPCPQTFEPRTTAISGRFYLKILPDKTLFAAHPVDVAE